MCVCVCVCVCVCLCVCVCVCVFLGKRSGTPPPSCSVVVGPRVKIVASNEVLVRGKLNYWG